MTTKIIALLGASAFALNSFAQNSATDPVLFSYGNDAVNKSEFVRVYEKHNANDSAQYSQKSVDEYLNLYTNFKLKVKEAEAMKLDTSESIRTQMDQYRKQLAQSFLQDKEITEGLIKEGYERLGKEIRVQHILINAAEEAAPTDTIVAYNKAMELYNQITKNKADFTDLAKKNSQDPSVIENNGDLGYITAFQTVYPFENAAYSTSKGSVSKPVRTKFGYHLVKVIDVRPARGKVQVAHILVKSNEKDAADKKADAKKRVENLYAEINKPGADFAGIAKTSSEDKETANKGGELPMFGSGRMFTEFEDAAFGLNNIGDVSKPIQTKIGWHIIKLLAKQPIGTYDAMKNDIRRRVERDTRSRVSPVLFINRLKKDYSFTETTANKDAFVKQVNADINTGKWKADDLKNNTKTLFELTMPDKTKKTTTVGDFATYCEINQIRAKSTTPDGTANKLYAMFVEESLKTAEESQLENKNPEFAQLMQEFRDGNLLYELMGTKVWNKAMQDTLGLKAFYETVKTKFMHPQRVEASIVTVKAADLKGMQKQLKKLDVAGVQKLKANAKNKDNTIETGMYEKGSNPIIDKVSWKEGIATPITNADGTVTLVKIHRVMAPMPKRLDEARGYVIADYQTELEKQWITELRTKYPVKVNEPVLRSLYK